MYYKFYIHVILTCIDCQEPAQSSNLERAMTVINAFLYMKVYANGRGSLPGRSAVLLTDFTLVRFGASGERRTIP
jgi:hypothetical protein